MRTEKKQDIANHVGQKTQLLRGQILTPLDEASEPLAFKVLCGVCRVTLPLVDGTFLIKSFLLPGSVGITPYKVTQRAAEAFVDAVTDSQLLVVRWSILEKEMEKSDSLRAWFQRELDKHHARKSEMWLDERALTSTERYMKLKEHLGNHFDAIPLHMVANHIGISPVHLSRLRQKLRTDPA